MGINFGIVWPNDTTMHTDNYLQLIYEGCLRNEAKCQERLYKLLAPKMLSICMRYAKDRDEAQDIMQEGFIKVFRHLGNFRNEGSLEGWIRHIMVNTAINRYRKSKNTVLVDDLAENDTLSTSGYKAIGVPGTVAGLTYAEKTYGRLTLQQVMARFEKHERVLAAVAYRNALPLSVSEKLVTLVSDQVRDHLIARHAIAPETALNIAVGTAERATVRVMRVPSTRRSRTCSSRKPMAAPTA